ncbi:TetR/AcrR family transcriptional regulator [uncultured Ruthenibacterium sp.]|uniref:TetR/AcrR family transcriptional regulator n=1 Tax=uncultured Ruthenibacterium sp. TaxID=1905347 RepID=UPI00349E70A3
MSLEEIREQNKQRVVQAALDVFVRQGIANTTVADIARAAGLTERSVYRYYKTKLDLVQAAAYLYYDRMTEEANRRAQEVCVSDLPGIEQIRQILTFYSHMYLEYPAQIRFCADAEMALSTAGRDKEDVNWPPEQFEISNSPLVRAIRKGLADGSVSQEVDVASLYYNAYDSILGVMQKMSYERRSLPQDACARMNQLCEIFVAAFRGNFQENGRK